MEISLTLTHNCNLRCTYCFAGKKSKNSMELETGKKSVDFVFENNQENDLTFNFFGGEPLLCFDSIKEIVSYIKLKNEVYKKRVDFTVTTNGTIVDEGIADYLIDNRFAVTLSLDGNEYSQNQHRKTIDGRGSYELVKDKIPYWLRIQKEGGGVSVRMTIDTGNVDGLFNSVRDLADMGFVRIVFTPSVHDEWDDGRMLVLHDQYKKIADFYIERMKAGKPFSCSNIEKYITRKIKKTIPGCSIIKGRYAISPNGNIYPCHRFVREDDDFNLVIGNVYDGFNAKKDEFLENFNRVKGCTSCFALNRCGNVCPAVNYSTSPGDINKKHWFSCYNERISLEISDHVGKYLFENQREKFIQHLLGPKESGKISASCC